MKKLITKFKVFTLILLASACHKEISSDIEIPYGVELITQPGDCVCKQWKEFEVFDSAIFLYPSFASDSLLHKNPYSLIYFKDTLLFWSTTTFMGLFGPVCNPPEILKNLEIPIEGLKVKTKADVYKSCKPDHNPAPTEKNIIFTSFIILKP